MINYNRGDTLLVKFTFSEGEGLKHRPALVLSTEGYNSKRRELIMAAVTSNLERQLAGDTKINGWKEAGLLYPSLVTAIIRTIKQNMVARKLGTLSNNDFQTVEKNLKGVLGFSKSHLVGG